MPPVYGTTAATEPEPRRPPAPGPERPRTSPQVHQPQGRSHRLQGPEPPAPVHLRSRQDPLPAGHRPVAQASAAAGPRGEARARAGASALRRRALMQAVLLKDVEGLGESGDAI